MTRWNASTSTLTLLHLLVSLSSPTFVVAFRFQTRHDGKSHKNHGHKDIDARQDIPNMLVEGLGINSSPSAAILPAVPALTPSLPLAERFETISAMDAANIGGPVAPSMTSMNAANTINGPTTRTSFAPPIFPTTVIQIPVYTICPDTAGHINATSTPALNATALYSNATTTGSATGYPPPILPAISVTINATALLSNGSYTTFLSQSLSTPAADSITAAPAPNARIILGTNGCQTVYSASTTRICSAVIARGGQLPLSVSDCSQWVTFSSSSIAAVPTCDCSNIPVTPTNILVVSASQASQTISGILNSETVGPATADRSGASAESGIAFYAAPWHEIAAGLVPALVQVANCPDGSGKNCSTSSESWSVSTSTSTVTSTRTVQYAGVSLPCLIPCPPL